MSARTLLGFALLSALTAPIANAQTDHVFIGRYREKAGNESPLYVYSQGTHAVTQSTAFASPPAVEGVNFGTRGRGPLFVAVQGGVTYVLMQAAATSKLEVLTFDSGNKVLTPVGASYTFPNTTTMVVPSPDRQRLYFGVGPGGAANAFNEIWSVDISALPAVGNAQMVANLKDANGTEQQCYTADIHPSGTRLIAACLGNKLFDVDLNQQNQFIEVPLPPSASSLNYEYGALRIEPTQGKFAYLGGAKSAPHPILVLDLQSGIGFGPEIATLNPHGSIAFHPTGKWAYVTPAGGGTPWGTMLLLETAPNGLWATTVTDAIPSGGFGGLQYGYDLAISEQRLYFHSANNADYLFTAYDLNTSNGLLTAHPAGSITLTGLGPAGDGKNPAQGLLAIAPTLLVNLTVKANIPGAEPVVQLNSLPTETANSVSRLVPVGSEHDISTTTPQGGVPAATAPRYVFLNKWTREPNTCDAGTTFASSLGTRTAAVAAAGDTYWACFARQWLVTANVTGSCSLAINGIPVASGSGVWVAEGATATAAATPLTGWSAPAPASTTVDAAGKVLNLACSELSACAAAGSIPPPPSMTGWYHFDETSGTTANSIAGAKVPATWIGSPAPSGGRVAGALTMSNTAHVQVSTPMAYNVGTGELTLDAWIRLTNVSGIHTIVDKREALSGGNDIRGYLFYVINGRLGFQMADGVFVAPPPPNNSTITPAAVTFTNFATATTAPLVTANTWAHVAVTVRRATNGGIFYLNGVAIGTFDAGLRPLSLDTNQRLLIGRNALDSTGFTGAIDELEIFPRALASTEVAAIFGAGAAGKCKLPPVCSEISNNPGLVGWWSFEETGTSLSRDRRGNDDYLLPRSGAPSRVTGQVNQAVQFLNVPLNGSASLLTAGSTPELNFTTNSFTIDAWIRYQPNVAGDRAIVDKSGGVNQQTSGYAFFVRNGYLAFSATPTGGTPADLAFWQTATTRVDTNAWVHVAVVLDRTTNLPTFYVNGQPEPISSSAGALGNSSIASTAPLNVGGFNRASSNTQGAIDELEIFNIALTQTQIDGIYRALNTGKCPRNDQGCIPAPQNMVSWYPFTTVPGQSYLNDHATTNSVLNQVGTLLYPAGPVGNAVRIVMSSTYLEAAANYAEHNFGIEPFSVDFYLRSGFSNVTKSIVEKMEYKPAEFQGWSVRIVNNKLRLVFASNGNVLTYTSSLDATTFPSAWKHITVVADRASDPRIYFDGVLDPGVTRIGSTAVLTGDITNTIPMRVGVPTRTLTGAPFAVEMDVDELELFHRSLLVGEVEALALTKAGKCPRVPEPYVPPAGFPVKVDTNLNPVQGITVGITTLPPTNTATDVYQNANVPPGTQTVSAQPDKEIDNANPNIQWTFVNWSFNGTPNPAWTNAAAQPVPVSAPGGTYTANYEAWGKLTVVVNGSCVPNLTTGFYPMNPGPIVTVPGPGTPVITYLGPTLGGGTAPSPESVQNGTRVNTLFPGGTLTVNCGTTVVVGVNTNPPAMGALVGVVGQGLPATNFYMNQNVPNGPHKVSTSPTTILNNAQDTEYRFNHWRINGVPDPNSAGKPVYDVVIPTTSPNLYTAAYDVWYKFTVNMTGPCNVNQSTAFFKDNTSFGFAVFVANSGSITSLTRTSNGITTNLPTGNATAHNILMNGPVVINAVCAGPAVGVTVNTNPANLGATVGIGGGTGPNSYTATLPPGSSQTLTAPATIVSPGGIGYRFNNWTPQGASVTLPGSGPVTYTANYTVACYMIAATVSPANTGTVSLSPQGLPDFPAGCYPQGTAVTATLTPVAGRTGNGWLPFNGGSGQGGPGPLTFTVVQPALLTATTTAAAAQGPVLEWRVQSRTNGNISMGVKNIANANLLNVRINSIASITNGFVYSGFALPATVPGAANLAPNNESGFNLVFNRPGAAASAAFSFTMTVEANGVAPYQVTINVP